jgi:hypothetical protein
MQTFSCKDDLIGRKNYNLLTGLQGTKRVMSASEAWKAQVLKLLTYTPYFQLIYKCINFVTLITIIADFGIESWKKFVLQNMHCDSLTDSVKMISDTHVYITTAVNLIYKYL